MAQSGSQAPAGEAGLVDYALLVTLAAIWGGSFLFIKIAIDTIPPMTIAAGRIALAAAILYLAARIAGQRLPEAGRAPGSGSSVSPFSAMQYPSP